MSNDTTLSPVPIGTRGKAAQREARPAEDAERGRPDQLDEGGGKDG